MLASNLSTDQVVFTSSSFNVSISNSAKNVVAATPQGPVTFPSFTAGVFPGYLVISFYRFSWSAYSLSALCSSFTEQNVDITIDAFHFVSDSAIVHVPAQVPDLDWFDPCEFQPYYSLTGTFSNLNPLYFPIDPEITGITWVSPVTLEATTSQNVSSLCVYEPRTLVRFNLIQNVTPPVRVGEVRTLDGVQGAIQGLYGSTVNDGSSAVNYTAYPTTAPTFEGEEYLEFPLAYLRFELISSIGPVDQVILTSDLDVNVTLEAVNYRDDYRYYFRVVSDVAGQVPDTLILPESPITLITTSATEDVLFEFSVDTCVDFSEAGTVLIQRPRAITLEGESFVPNITPGEDEIVFALGDYFTLGGDMGVPITVTFVASRGLFTNTVCQACSTFSFIGGTTAARTLIDATTVAILVDGYLANYDGIRGNASGEFAYSRFLAGSVQPPTASLVDQINASSLWIIIVLYVFAALLLVAGVGYLLMSPIGKRKALPKVLTEEGAPLLGPPVITPFKPVTRRAAMGPVPIY